MILCAAKGYSFARKAFGEIQGRAVAALFSVTPMVLFMAGTWMNHVPVLCLTTIALAALYGNVHTLGRALEYAMTYVSELNMYLMAWPTPALLLVILSLLTYQHTARWDALLFGLFVAQVATYASYSLVGEFLGPRFLSTALPTLVVILARSPFLVGERFGGTAQRVALAAILTCLIVAWIAPSAPRVLLLVQRSGDCGSPLVSGSTSASSRSGRAGSPTSSIARPPPAPRIRPGASGAFSNSRRPFVMVTRDKPHARLTAEMP